VRGNNKQKDLNTGTSFLSFTTFSLKYILSLI